MKDSFKALFDQGPSTYQKSIGFTVSVQKSIQKALVLQYRSEKVFKKHLFYSIGLQKYRKSIGFAVSVRKSIEKPLVLQTEQPNLLKSLWFYKPGNRNC